jgi:hypothetical protein
MLTRVVFGCDFAEKYLVPILHCCSQANALIDNSLTMSVNTGAFDRHRGSGCPLTAATPPCVRVRTRRFEKLRCYFSTNEGRIAALSLNRTQRVSDNNT